jgi:xyloglucan-specific exo-beta-1,4-glucanase
MKGVSSLRFSVGFALVLGLAACGSEQSDSPPLPPFGAGGTEADPAPQPTTPQAPGGSGAAGTGGTLGENGPGEQTPLVPPPEPVPDSAPNASGYVWRTVAIGGGGFVSGIITSRATQGLIYARTDVGGAYRWSESSRSWIALMDWIAEDQKGLWGVESLALDESDPRRVYMLAGIEYFDAGRTAILASEDGGTTFTVHDVTAQFTAHGNGAGRQNGERLAVDPANGTILFAGTRDNGLFKSADRAQSWQRVAALDVTTTPNGNGIAFVLFDPSALSASGTQRIYVGVSRSGATNLFVSNDAGQSFEPVAGQPTIGMPQRATFGAGGALFVTYGNGAGPNGSPAEPMDQGALYKLDTASGQWTDVSPLRGADARAFGGVSASADGQRLLATTINTYQQQPWGYGDRLFLSENGGDSWTDLFGAGRISMDTNGFPWIENNAIHWAGSIVLDPFDPSRAWVTSGNGIFQSSEVGAAPSSWQFSGAGVEETVPLDAVSVPGGSLVSVIGDYDGFVHEDLDASPSAGRHVPSMGTTTGLALAAQNTSVLARVGAELYLSSDGAESWQLVPRPNANTQGRVALSADGAVLLWSVDDEVQRTADRGATWSPVTGITFENAIAADGVAANKFYAYDRGTGAFVVSSDAGATFGSTATLPAGGALRLRALPGVEGDVWVPLGNGGLTRTTNSGESFQALASVQSCDAVGFGAPAPGAVTPAVYIWGSAGGGPRGVYRSSDGGVTWLRVNDDAHQYGGPGNGQFVIGDANVYGRVYMSTAGRGIVYGELASGAD